MLSKLAANLSMLFTEQPFLERFEAAANAGFNAVEYLFPYDYPAAVINRKLLEFGLKQVLFNAPAGDWNAGERGIACLPGREVEFARAFELALSYAKVLGNQKIHVMAGILPPAASPAQARSCYISNLRYAARARSCYISNLRYAARAASKVQLQVLIEPINNIDMPGYFLNFQREAVDLIEEIAEPNVRLQFDCYHCQIMQGNVVATFKQLQPYIGHVQIAGVPGRHEPNTGELNYVYILQQLANSGYTGHIGCEYLPLNSTVQGLSWINDLSPE
ncbi:MAG: hydroxypyruvate isomerase [Osedax symbiont Rs1]|nr:MAG: hydroxypyruvate isomerase [Osedax symbiont Rs1]